jgi:hypothetical protein
VLCLVSSLVCKLLGYIFIVGGVVIDLFLIVILMDLLLRLVPGFANMRFAHPNLKIVLKLCGCNDLVTARQRDL